MSRTHLILLAIFFFTIPALPIEAMGQVNLRRYPVRGDGETLEMDRTEMYQNTIRYRRGMAQQRRIRRLEDRQARVAAYAADACGLGCEGHEGLQIRRIPGTHIAAVVYKALFDDDDITVQLRFHNDGPEPARLTIDPYETPDSVFLQIGEARLSILRDENGKRQSKGALDEMLEPGEIESWWARFPAPPSDARTFDLHIPNVIFRDVPLATD